MEWKYGTKMEFLYENLMICGSAMGNCYIYIVIQYIYIYSIYNENPTILTMDRPMNFVGLGTFAGAFTKPNMVFRRCHEALHKWHGIINSGIG